jgi:iron complex outermembrane receptor protein
MKSFHFSLLFFLLLLLAAPCFGQTAATEDEGEEESVSFSEIDIRGTIRRDELKSTSATILTSEDIEDRVYYQPLNMIEFSPGMSVIEYGEAGTSPQFQVRGFSARNDMSMYLDGIPLHDNGHAAGFTDSTVVMPIEIESVEIIKGPSSVYYGMRSVGASIPIQSIKGGNLTRLNLRYGSWNDMTITGLLARDNQKLAQVYAFEKFHSDGYRDNSKWDRSIFSGRWTYNLTDKFQASLNLRAYNAEWDSAGYVSHLLNTDRDAVDDGTGENNGGKRERYDARLWANYLINNESQLTFYLYASTLDFTRYQRSARMVGQATGSSLTEQYNRHQQIGSGLTYNWIGLIAGRDASFTSGITFSKDMDKPRQTWSIPWGMGRSRTGPPTSDVVYDIVSPAVLAEFNYLAHRMFNFRLGFRYDWLTGSFTNRRTNLHYDQDKKYKFFSPKIGLIFSPIDTLDIYANYGRGFQTPGSYDNGTFFNPENGLDLTVRDQFEIGARYSPANWLLLEADVFLLRTLRDTTYDPATETNVQAGKTERKGLDFSFNIFPFDNFRVRGNYAYLDAKTVDRITATLDYRGSRMPFSPRHIANLEISYAHPKGIGGRASVRVEQNSLYSDGAPWLVSGAPNPNYSNFKAPNITLVDLQFYYKFNDNYRVTLDVKNLMDKHYQGYAYGYVAATGDYLTVYRNPRAYYLTLQMNWDAKKE